MSNHSSDPPSPHSRHSLSSVFSFSFFHSFIHSQTILSDGEHYVHGMLATQHNSLVQQGQIKENTIIKLKDCMVNFIQTRRVVILLDFEVVELDHGSRVGDPKDFEKSGIQLPDNNGAPAPVAPLYNRTNQAPVSAPKPSQPSSNPAVNGSTNANNRYGSAPKNNYRSSQSASSSAPIVRSNPGVRYTLISQLNMYQNRWTIKARVTSKSEMRSWSNAKGEGTLFSVELLDSSGIDIKAVFFKEAADRFFPLLQENNVYTFSGGRIKVANVQWNKCKSSHELTFDQNSEIHLVDDTGDIQSQIYAFVKIADIENTAENTTLDIVGVVKRVGEPATIMSKRSGKELTKCDLTVADDSGAEINVTVWGAKANRAPSEFAQTPIVAFRRLRVSDYGGKSLSTTGDGHTVKDPKVPETDRVRQWWTSTGGQGTKVLSSGSGGGGRMEAFADRKTISSIKTESLGVTADKADYLSFKATLTFLKKDKEGGAWYTACANAGEPCKNRFKVTQTTDMNWYCDKCQGTYPNCVRRWIFSGTVSDDTSTTWVSFFNEQAETLLGALADDVYKETIEEAQNQDKYDSFFDRANFTDWVFRCKVKQELVGDETRTKTSVASMHPVDYAKESRELLTAISKF